MTLPVDPAAGGFAALSPQAAAERLEGLYGLDAGVLKLSGPEYLRKVGLWLNLAAERPNIHDLQRSAQVEMLGLRTWQTQLMKQADKFRAEGDITVEKDIMARVAQVGKWLAAAEAAAGLLPPAAQVAPSANPPMQLTEMGLADVY